MVFLERYGQQHFNKGRAIVIPREDNEHKAFEQGEG